MAEPAEALTPDRVRKLASEVASSPQVPAWRYAVEGYATPFAVTDFSAGVSFHARGLPYQNYVRIALSQLTSIDQSVRWYGFGATTVQDYSDATNAADAGLSQNGATWNVAGSIPSIPWSYPSGVYNAHYTSYYDANTLEGSTNDVRFVLRERVPGSRSKILVMTADTTRAAYAAYGNAGFYTVPMVPTVSYLNPSSNVYAQEVQLAQWAARNGIALEWCTGSMIDEDPTLLSHYTTFVSIGHDEYWSLNMRDNVEAFIKSGGNAAFLSGNTAMWQIRFQQNGSQIVCYKEDQSGNMDPVRDPALGGPTIEWWSTTLNRPSNVMTGSGFVAGAGWYDSSFDSTRLRGYQAQNTNHWIYQGTGLTDGTIFGQGPTSATSIIGYETDAAAYTMVSGKAVPTGTDGTPAGYEILGFADLTNWGPHGKAGAATMGYMKLGRGNVFSAGTVNWVGGLTTAGTSPVDIITRNVLHAFRTNTIPLPNPFAATSQSTAAPSAPSPAPSTPSPVASPSRVPVPVATAT